MDLSRDLCVILHEDVQRRGVSYVKRRLVNSIFGLRIQNIILGSG